MSLRLTVYLHGQPGSPAELALFGGAVPADWWVPDRQRDCAPGADCLDTMAAALGARAGGRPVRLVGFSLGAWVALELAARLPDMALQLELISPAGPLGDGAVLAEMAGGAVFGLARRAPGAFAMLAMVQGLAARFVPGLLAGALFRSAGGEDRALWRDAAFRRAMAGNLRAALGRGTAGYVREIRSYVGPWHPGIAAMPHPVRIWHGGADSWSPPALVDGLAALLGGRAGQTMLAGQGHYSTLRAWLAQAD